MRTLAVRGWIGTLLLLAVPACSGGTPDSTLPPSTATVTGSVAPSQSPSAVPTAKPITPPRADASLFKRQILFGNPDRAGVQISPNG